MATNTVYTNTASTEQVLDYWFGSDPSADLKTRSQLWFNGGKKVDDEIRNTFEPTIEAASMGALSEWLATAQGTLGLIVLLDQFPLNVYRKTAKAFASEQTAVEICLQGLEKEFDQQLSVVERLFFYLPLVHSENIDHQNQAVSLFEKLLGAAEGPEKTFAEHSLQSAVEHREQIRQFGRYPFRNEVLGRVSTEEEQAWLDDNPNRYGQ